MVDYSTIINKIKDLKMEMTNNYMNKKHKFLINLLVGYTLSWLVELFLI